jgi:nicotinate-nucleotide pyrophosphorylase (carboxylating)
MNRNLKKVGFSKLVERALKEDLGPGDITTEALFPKDRSVKSYLLAKEDLVLAGSEIFEEVLRQAGGNVRFNWSRKEGSIIKKGTRFCRMIGSLKTILKGERVALNFIQRLSGIATLTNRFKQRLKPGNITVIDTRKTTPLLRSLEKYAVKIGGGANHRFGLYDMILIKDNHIAPFGSVKKALGFFYSQKKQISDKKVEIETKSLRDVREAINFRPDVIMLDNMSISTMQKAIKMIGKRSKVEISGGINLKNIEKIKSLKADYVSIGALTHSPKSVDISLEIG